MFGTVPYCTIAQPRLENITRVRIRRLYIYNIVIYNIVILCVQVRRERAAERWGCNIRLSVSAQHSVVVLGMYICIVDYIEANSWEFGVNQTTTKWHASTSPHSLASLLIHGFSSVHTYLYAKYVHLSPLILWQFYGNTSSSLDSRAMEFTF